MSAALERYQAGVRNRLTEYGIASEPPAPRTMRLYHRVTGPADLITIDATSALANHPTEWAATPWPKGSCK